jgi:ketopantoate reductase
MGRKKIAIVGAGAVGGYTGAHMIQAGEDVTYIDPWPAHVEHMRKHGLRVTHAKDVPEFTVPVRALHVTDAQQLAKEQPVDIAFVCMKSYDTAWATMLIRQYLAPDGYVVSLQNCMNEETIAGVVGWSKLVTNAMANGIAACTGLTGGEMLNSDPIRHFSTRVGSEAIRIGQALGYQLEDIYHIEPETIARAGEGDEAAMRTCDEVRNEQGKRTSSGQRPSMGQDMQKGRRTEIEFLNGLIVREGEKLGLPCRANAVLTDLVKRVELGELKPDPRHITELRLN